MEIDRLEEEARFARTLLPLARRWRAEADKTLSALGLSHASGWVLLHVGRLGDAIRQSDLAAAIDMQGPSLVRQLDRLEKEQLIVRRVEPGDRRVNRVHLTAAGQALVGRIELALRGVRRRMFEGIGDADLAVAIGVLQTIDRRIGDRGGAA